jgi:hypothetical protein
MRKVTLQTRLAEADWHIAQTRKCIAQLKALVRERKRAKRDASVSQELIALSEEVLRLMLARRKFIWWALNALPRKQPKRIRGVPGRKDTPIPYPWPAG